MKIIQLFLLISLPLGILSCRCEGTFRTTSYIENKSNQEARLLFYKGNLPNEKQLARGDSIRLDEAHGRTKGTGEGFINLGLSVYDSILIEFRDGKKLVHYYRLNKPINNTNTLIYTNKRNVFNPDNFKQHVLSEDKCHMQTLFLYTLTNEDYAASR